MASLAVFDALLERITRRARLVALRHEQTKRIAARTVLERARGFARTTQV